MTAAKLLQNQFNQELTQKLRSHRFTPESYAHGNAGRRPETISISFVEFYSNMGQVWDRKVTEYNGERIHDTHWAGETIPGRNKRKTDDPWKHTTNKNKAKMKARGLDAHKKLAGIRTHENGPHESHRAGLLNIPERRIRRRVVQI